MIVHYVNICYFIKLQCLNIIRTYRSLKCRAYQSQFQYLRKMEFTWLKTSHRDTCQNRRLGAETPLALKPPQCKMGEEICIISQGHCSGQTSFHLIWGSHDGYCNTTSFFISTFMSHIQREWPFRSEQMAMCISELHKKRLSDARQLQGRPNDSLSQLQRLRIACQSCPEFGWDD